MAVIAEGQRQSFTDRLHRIERGAPNTMGTIYAGTLEDGGGMEHRKRKKAPSKRKKTALGTLMSLPVALAIGAAAMLAGRVAAFHLAQNPDVLPPEQAEMILRWADIGIAVTLMLILGWITGTLRGIRKFALAGGVAAMMLGEVAFIQQAPDLFIPMFSEDYVQQAIVTPSPLDTLPETLETLPARLDATVEAFSTSAEG